MRRVVSSASECGTLRNSDPYACSHDRFFSISERAAPEAEGASQLRPMPSMYDILPSAEITVRSEIRRT